jgi:hypothetical protein
MPITAALIVGGGIAAGKGIQSAVRARRAKKEMEALQKNLKNPTYELPEELLDAYNRQLGQKTDMPGLGLAQYGLDLSYSNSLGNASRAATSSQDLLAAATGLGQQKMMGGLQLAETAAQFKGQAEQRKMQGISQLASQLAQSRDTMYEQNELDPFLRTSAAISALREKRYQESNNTFDAFAQLGMTAAGGIDAANGVQPGGLPGGITNMLSSLPTGGGSGMGGTWQNQIGGSFGGGYYDPYLQTWVPG